MTPPTVPSGPAVRTDDSSSEAQPSDVRSGGPEISVAVSSYQRARALPPLLEALERQTLEPDRFEVVIADNGSTDDTPAVLAQLVASTPLDVRVVRVEQNRGPASGRNAAWRATRSPVVAFTDDDCCPSPTWLERGLDAMRREPAVVIGRTLPNQAHLDRSNRFAHTVTVNHPTFAETCNALYVRDDLDRVGGFDESFPTPAGEDTDLAWRVRKECGRAIRFGGDVVVYHEIQPRTFRQAARATLRWDGIAKLVALHTKESRAVFPYGYFWKASHPKVLLAALGLALALRWRWAVLLGIPWFLIRFPRGLRARAIVRYIAHAPGLFVVDAMEVFSMARGSIRYRTFIL